MDRDDLTIIYYSSNREKPEFENKVMDSIKKQVGNTQIISVTHRPINFGFNIPVGDVGLSDYNIYRQMQIGCQMAKTKYVCTTEADCFYPPTGYFDFIPPDTSAAYHYTNLYILWKGSHIFNQKAFSLCGLFSNREFLLNRFNRSIDEKVKWRADYKPKHPLSHKWRDWTPFKGDIPIINCKTGQGMRNKTGVNTEGRPQKELPYWGKAINMEERLWKI